MRGRAGWKWALTVPNSDVQPPNSDEVNPRWFTRRMAPFDLGYFDREAPIIVGIAPEQSVSAPHARLWQSSLIPKLGLSRMFKRSHQMPALARALVARNRAQSRGSCAVVSSRGRMVDALPPATGPRTDARRAGHPNTSWGRAAPGTGRADRRKAQPRHSFGSQPDKHGSVLAGLAKHRPEPARCGKW